MTAKSIKSSLESEAASLLALCNGATLDQRIDIFKAVSAFHIAATKVKGKEPDATGPTFNDIRSRVNGAGKGVAA